MNRESRVAAERGLRGPARREALRPSLGDGLRKAPGVSPQPIPIPISDLRDPSPSQILGTFSEVLGGLPRQRERPLGRIPYGPVVIITRVQYLGPPGPFSFPDSRDLLEVLGGPPDGFLENRLSTFTS